MIALINYVPLWCDTALNSTTAKGVFFMNAQVKYDCELSGAYCAKMGVYAEFLHQWQKGIFIIYYIFYYLSNFQIR